jgi:beta-lactamase class A
MTFRKLLTIIVYTCVAIIIGRNMTFLPKVPFVYDKATVYNTDLIKKNLAEYLKKQNGHYSISVVDLKSPLTFGLHESTVLTGASVNKVHIVAALYYLAQKGKIDLDQKIVVQKKDIQNYGTGSLRYQKAGKSYSLKTLAKLTLQQSDNTAAYLLANKIGRETIQKIMEDFGLSQTDMLDNKTSLHDVALLYQKIYQNKVTSPALTKELLGFMKDTDIEDRLPAFLPDDVAVFHKTGDGVGFVHDVGIISDDKHTYFLGVLSSDVGGEEKQAAGTIAQISKIVYDYMKSQE